MAIAIRKNPKTKNDKIKNNFYYCGKMVNVNSLIPEKLRKEYQLIAISRGISYSTVIREALIAYKAKYEDILKIIPDRFFTEKD